MTPEKEKYKKLEDRVKQNNWVLRRCSLIWLSAPMKSPLNCGEKWDSKLSVLRPKDLGAHLRG
jgi:hypothetical protein